MILEAVYSVISTVFDDKLRGIYSICNECVQKVFDAIYIGCVLSQ